MVTYEKEYQTSVHRLLYSNNKYYYAKASLAIIKYFKGILKDSKILDFGCGLGQNIFLLKNAVGYDISKFSLNFCKEKGIKVISNLKKLKDESFDIVFSCHVLEHVESPSETIKLMKEKLKKYGKIILVLPVEKHSKKVNFNMTKSQHLYSWNFKTINNLLIKNGFRIIENKYLKGSGYKKLLLFSFNLKLYRFLTVLASFFKGQTEMKITAVKV